MSELPLCLPILSIPPPARELLIASYSASEFAHCENPCPCGYHGDPVRECTCSLTQVLRYQKRISGPLLDRIDIHIDVPRVEYDKLTSERLGESSAQIRARVERARERHQSYPWNQTPSAWPYTLVWPVIRGKRQQDRPLETVRA